ncbi:MAG: hypothetical protein JKY54_04415 [Flavobacteriales bacterium]|nr:hypothetical protein [Flavobacteriales bacterium]
MPEHLKNPSISFFGIQVDEPVTMMTDILVGVVCFYALYKLMQKKRKGTVKGDPTVFVFLKYFFLLMGISTVLGGFFGHGFNYALNIYWKLPYWGISMFSVALAERAVIVYSAGLTKPFYAKFFRWLNLIELAAFMVISFVTLDFIFVVIHSAYGLLVIVGIFHGYIYYKTRSQGSKLFLIGVFISLIGAVCFLTKFGFGHWFNHLDITHTLMAISGWFFYKGGAIMVEDPEYKNTVAGKL